MELGGAGGDGKDHCGARWLCGVTRRGRACAELASKFGAELILMTIVGELSPALAARLDSTGKYRLDASNDEILARLDAFAMKAVELAHAGSGMGIQP